MSGKVAVKHIEIVIIHVEQSGELVQSHFVRAVSSVIMIFEVMQLYSVNLRVGQDYGQLIRIVSLLSCGTPPAL